MAGSRRATVFVHGSLAAIALTALVAVAGNAVSASAAPTFSFKQVKAHASAGNCWSIVNGGVYNLTKWIPRHPGGAGVIKAMCGRNATAAFAGKHGLKGSEAKRLATFKIGVLARAATAVPTPKPSGPIAASAVAGHNTATDCWTIVNGNAYNVTSWIARHPGGPAVIKGMCGIDATPAFTLMHGTKAGPTAMLATFLIGPVTGAASPTPTPSPTATETATAGIALTVAEVAKHSTAADCWSIVDGSVFNLTGWVSQHPGGASYIVAMCGIDATTAFGSKHGLAGSQARILATYRIGALGDVSGNTAPSGAPAPPPVAPPAPPAPPAAGTVLSVAEVAKHNTGADCWSIVNGSVFNLTNWVGAHPGGTAPIIAMCGIDATAAFGSKHGLAGSQAAILNNYRIGAVGAVVDPGGTVPTAPPIPTYTAAEVRGHNTQASCWAVVNTRVYDLTNWIARHPGGRTIIIAACGRNATTAFTTQEHHGTAEWKTLDTFSIGLVSAADAATLATAPREV